MNAMELTLLVGTEEMCMFHEPAGFWPNIFLSIVLEALKSHYAVSRLAQAGTTNEEKVNWRSFNFNATSREHTLRENARIFRKSLSKSVKNELF
jgi:hypothetical protein